MNSSSIRQFLDLFTVTLKHLPNVFAHAISKELPEGATVHIPAGYPATGETPSEDWWKNAPEIIYVLQNGIEHERNRIIPAHIILQSGDLFIAMYAYVTEPGVRIMTTQVEAESIRALQIASSHDVSKVFGDLL